MYCNKNDLRLPRLFLIFSVIIFGQYVTETIENKAMDQGVGARCCYNPIDTRRDFRGLGVISNCVKECCNQKDFVSE